MESVLEKVRRALGRSAPLDSVPPPPPIDEPITRLVHMDVGLPELFAKSAGELKMETEFLSVDVLVGNLISWLREKKIHRIMLSDSVLLNRLEIQFALRREGFDARRWSEISLDQSYDFDCGLTDATWAVAETGTLVIKTTPSHGRALTLVPMYHVAILEPRNFLPDSVDLFQKLTTEAGSYTVMISGPSKTADIEMNVVTGVHGPNVVKAYILQ
jgi:L-lactate utilization protein LutC